MDAEGEDEFPAKPAPPWEDAVLDQPGDEGPADGTDVQVDEDLWQALAMAAEEAGRGSAGTDDSLHEGEDPEETDPS